MHSIAYLFRRKPGLTKEQFANLYEQHREVMLAYSTGLVSYTQHRLRDKHDEGDVYTTKEAEVYDALSVYTYDTPQNARTSSDAPEIIKDSERFIDFETMVSLPIDLIKVL